jgi:hypothetical protein
MAVKNSAAVSSTSGPMKMSNAMQNALDDVPRCGLATSSVLTAFYRDQVFVWLRGEVDLALAPDLDAVAAHAPYLARRLTIDAARVRFCDSNVVNFIVRTSSAMPVTVRRPSSPFSDLMAAAGLAQLVSIDHAPGQEW